MDAFGHVNNAVYATYLEECRDEWLDAALGGDGDRWDFVIARVAIDFRRELRLGRRRRLVALRARADRHLERDHARGDPDAATSWPPRPRPCSSPATGRRGGRGRSPQASATASSACASALARPPVQPACARPCRAGEPDRLDRAPDDARARAPADRRLRRLPRGAGAGRRRTDRAGGDGGAPIRTAHLAHARRLPPGDRRRLPARRGRGAAARDAALRPAAPRRSRADRDASARAGAGPVARAEPSIPLEPRAATGREIEELVAGHALAAGWPPRLASTESRSRRRTGT